MGRFRHALAAGAATLLVVLGWSGSARAQDPVAADFQKVVLDDNTQNPMELDVAPDGRVFYIERDGRLQIWTGDNSNPYDSSGFDPIDERPGREYWDAQRTAGNTNDLNGKILRIKPMDVPLGPPGVNTTYTIPAGNLFDEAQDTDN